MTHFEYVIILVSIVLGLSVTKLLTGVGEMLQARAHAKQYWVHNVWVANAFISNLMVWWVAYRWLNWEQDGHTWNFFLFVFILLTPIVQFLVAVLLFPDEIREGQDMRDPFESIQRPLFLLLATLPLIDIVDSTLKGLDHVRNLGPAYLPTLLLSTALNVTAAFTTRRNFHAVFGVVNLVMMLVYIFAQLNELGIN